MEGEEWKRCPLHGEVCKLYCEDCKILYCDRCQEHEEHNICFFKKYVHEHKDEIPLSHEYTEVINLVDDAMNHIKERKFEIENERDEAEIYISSLESIAANTRKAIEDDITILEKMRAKMSEAECEIITSEGKMACRKAIQDLCVDDKIREEANNTEKKKAEVAREILLKKNRVEELNLQFIQLEKIRGELERGLLDEEGKFLLILLKNKGTLDFNKLLETPYKINCSIDNFKACTNLKMKFPINDVMKQKLIDVGESIMMSEPIDVNLSLKTGNIKTANISHHGVISLCSKKDKNFSLEFYDLFENNQVEINIENYTSTAFYDDNVILLTYEHNLREAPVVRIFNQAKTTTFDEIADVELGYCPPNSLTQDSRKVYYKSGSDMYEYDVDTKEISQMVVDRLVSRLAFSCGIDMDVKCVFKSLLGDKLYAMMMNNKSEYIGVEDKNSSKFTVFASSSSCNDLNKALYKMNDHFVYKGKVVNLNTPVKFYKSFTNIRIYKDIFLVYDISEQWKFIRISVP